MKFFKNLKTIFAFNFVLLFSLSIITEARGSDLSMRVVQEDEAGIIIEATTLNYSVKPAPINGYQMLSIEGCGTNDVSGAPGVAMTGQLIEIPEGSKIELALEQVEKSELHNFLLAPSPYRKVTENDTGEKSVREEYKIDPRIYATDTFFPGKLASVEFTGYMRDKSVASIKLNPVQYNPVAKTLEIHKKFRVHVKYIKTKAEDVKTSITQNRTINKPQQVNADTFQNIYKSTLLNYKSQPAATTSLIQQKTNAPATIQSMQMENSPFAVRVTVQEEGVYKISYENLATLGINLSSTTNENIKVENRGNEIPLYRSGTGSFKAGDYVLFYGEPFKSLYAKKNVYWIYQGSSNGKSMTIKDGSQYAGYPVQTSFNNIYRGEEDKKYWETIPNGEGVDHWFWERLQPTETTAAAANFIVPLNNIVTTGGDFSIKVNLRAETSLAHQTRVYVNNNPTPVVDFSWQGQKEQAIDIPNISPNLFLNGNNTIKIEEILAAGTSVDRIYINWFEINYIDSYVAENDMLKFKGEGSGSFAFEVTNFSNSDIWIFDITDPLNVLRITTQLQIPNKFGDNLAGIKFYYATTSVKFKIPSDISVDEPSSLKSTRDDMDYIIITNEAFYNDIAALKEYRTSKGLNVEIVKIQDIYDEFSYGIKDARAIKDFLTYAYSNWNVSSHPAYVLLVGDASIDYRDDTGNFSKGNVDFVPTYLYQSFTLGDTPTDNWFACVSGTDPIPDMIIGRLCVKTSEDVNNIIDKIKAYEQGAAGAWTKRIIVASDDGGDFESLSDKLAALLPEGFTAEKVYLSNYSSVEQATSDLINKINAGSLITNYTGHGSVDNWAGEFLFHTPDDKDSIPRNDVGLLTNGDRLTFVMTLNCLNGFFPNFLDKYSLAEEFMRAQNKGAIACLAPTGLGFTSEHDVLAEKIFNLIFTDADSIAGSVVYTGKINAFNQIQSRDILETFTLFGDPATELKISTASSAITLVSPDDNAPLPRNQRPTFSWEDAQNIGKYKIEFSPDSTFTGSKMLRMPMLGFATNTEFTPRFFAWFLLKIMSNRNGQVYWRVAGYDANNELLGYSNSTRNFTIAR